MRREDIVIENTIHYALDKIPFIGSMLQLLNIKCTKQVPTAGVMYNPQSKNFEMVINMDFFKTLSTDERVAIFTHEIYHILHKHLISIHQTRYLASQEQSMMWNVSMDLAINQYIENLPKFAMKLEMFKDINGKDLEKEKPFEYYYDQIDWNKAKKDYGYKGDPNCQIHGQGNKESKEDEGTLQLPQHSHSTEGKKCTCKGGLFPLDDHQIMQESAGNSSQEEQLKALGDILRRTKQKSQYGFSNSPKFIQDLLNEIEKNLSQIDYKRILAKAIRKSLPADDRQNTWMRPSKRYNYMAPGTRNAEAPRVDILVDSSGSISVDEINMFLGEVDAILKTTKSYAMVHLFHTQLYKTVKFKRGFGLKELEGIQSGGTCLQHPFDVMRKTKTDVVIVLTDGYYGDIEFKGTPNFNVVFAISKGGQLAHPLRRLGQTVEIK